MKTTKTAPLHKRLSKKFKHYFIPHKGNKFKPLFLRIETVGATTALILVLFFGAAAADHFLVTSSSPQVAAVVASTLVDLANTDRTQNGLPGLKADDEAAKSYFAHTSPDGQDPWYWFAQAGYHFTYAGENLAVYFSDSDAVNTAWMNSPEHRANILNDHFTEIGIATAQGMYQGQETTFVVQEFGTPAAVAVHTINSALQAAVASAPAASAAVTGGTPSVKGASIKEAPVHVLEQTPTFIAVENTDAPAPDLAPAGVPREVSAAATTNPIQTTLLKFVTSPQTDLDFVYTIIGAIVALALILEVAIEVRRQHPHRIAMGLSLISLMIILVYVGHTLVAGQLMIV
jgi:uncharacterized protein YkwD